MAEKKLMFTIPNQVAQRVTEGAPWEFTPNVPEQASRTKGEYQTWRSQPSTQHCLYSLVEGAVRGMRVSADNPIVKVHGIIADYDTIISEDLLNTSIADCKGEFRPNWVHSTPHSGGRRLIWLFQVPALVTGNDMAKLFCAHAAKKLRAKNYLPGLDYEALKNPTIYYDVGSRWRELDAAYVPETFVYSWLFDIGRDADRTSFPGVVIPLKDIKKEMDERFPGRWAGEFEIGSSGPRFWDAAADNPRACVVNKFGTGMHCFTGSTAFMPWSAIFGAKFCEKYAAETLGAVMAGTWFDKRNYWRLDAEGHWQDWSLESYSRYLRVHHQLSSVKPKGRNSSEVDDVIHAVETQKLVQGAFPYVYFPSGPIVIDGERNLNISNVQVLQPVADEKILAWGEGFPWFASFLKAFLPEETPRQVFLGWLKNAYVPAYQRAPRPGHIVILAGDVNRGKSLMSTVIISKLLGGSADASRLFLGEEDFPDYVYRKPLMTVDDDIPSSSTVRHVRYSAMLKKMAANSSHNYARKFKDTGKVIWLGRVIVTCNTDSESIRLLPNMELSDAEKISLFKCNSEKVFPFKFPERPEIVKTLDQELPYLGRWLLQWEIPANLRGDPRWGVVHYHDPVLLDNSIQAGDAFGCLEVVQMFLRSYLAINPGVKEWTGSAATLLRDMHLDEGLKPLVSKYSTVSMGKHLSQLHSQGFAITPERTSRLGRFWRIATALANTETVVPKGVKREDK